MNDETNTIVLVHGFGFDAGIWTPVAPAFDGYRVISLSLPGFGEERVAGPYTIASLADFYWKELDKNGVGPFHLVGHSMGGYVVMEMAAQQMDRVGSLTLVHSHVYEDPADKKKKRDESIAAIEKDGRQGFAEKMIGVMVGSEYKPQSDNLLADLIKRGITHSDDAWKNGLAAMRDRRDHESTLKQLTVPVLMIMGEEDAAIPLDFVYKQAAVAERGDLIVLPGVGHLSMYEKTDEVTDILRRFFERVIQ
jgi:pimeloyl-ACP methyl ester carboxylesterase